MIKYFSVEGCAFSDNIVRFLNDYGNADWDNAFSVRAIKHVDKSAALLKGVVDSNRSIQAERAQNGHEGACLSVLNELFLPQVTSDVVVTGTDWNDSRIVTMLGHIRMWEAHLAQSK
jgi:hypothetical protein